MVQNTSKTKGKKILSFEIKTKNSYYILNYLLRNKNEVAILFRFILKWNNYSVKKLLYVAVYTRSESLLVTTSLSNIIFKVI